TSSLIYAHPDCAAKVDAIAAFLGSRDWVDRVIAGTQLASIGLAPHHGLALAISLKSDEEPNPFGVRGRSCEARPAPGKATHLNGGRPGGWARYEQAPFLMLDGPGFIGGPFPGAPPPPPDIPPTTLAPLKIPAEGMEGRPLQG